MIELKIEISKRNIGIILGILGIIIAVIGLMVSDSSGAMLRNIGIGVFFIIFGIFIAKQQESKKK